MSALGEVNFADDVMAGLGDAELVFPRTPSRFQHTTELAFKHEFTRAVAYDTIALAERPELHRRAPSGSTATAACARASSPSRSHVTTTRRRTAKGVHVVRARGPPLGEPKRVRRRRQAVGIAATSGATTQQDRDRALVSLGYAHIVAGALEEARGLLLGLRSGEPSSDPDAVATQMHVCAELARIAIFLDGDYALARDLLTEGLAMSTGDDTVRAELMLRHQLGNLAIWTGDYDEAIRIHEANVERAVEGSEFYRRGWGLNSLSFALTQSGQLDRAMVVADRVIRAADELGDPRLRMGGIAQKGVVALFREDWTESLAWFGEAQELNRRNGDPEKFATVANYLGEAALGAGLSRGRRTSSWRLSRTRAVPARFPRSCARSPGSPRSRRRRAIGRSRRRDSRWCAPTPPRTARSSGSSVARQSATD